MDEVMVAYILRETLQVLEFRLKIFSLFFSTPVKKGTVFFVLNFDAIFYYHNHV